MSARLSIHKASPFLTIQDMGRPGFEDRGMSASGAADRLALLEAAALLGMPGPAPAIEMAGMGGEFSVDAPTRFCLTGAPMRATIDDNPVRWNATHRLHPTQRLVIGGVLAGVYGYLSVAGGVQVSKWLGSASVHLAAGIGAPLMVGAQLPLADDPRANESAVTLTPQDRFSGGEIRVFPGPQTELFPKSEQDRFFATSFTRDALANRQGVRLHHKTDPFCTRQINGLASDFIISGDIQMTGEGIPYVLLCESQTIGGYPRIGTILPDDLPRMAQAPAGSRLVFTRISTDNADRLYRTDADRLSDLRGQLRPLILDPRDIHDLLSYQLISGVTNGDDRERT